MMAWCERWAERSCTECVVRWNSIRTYHLVYFLSTSCIQQSSTRNANQQPRLSSRSSSSKLDVTCSHLPSQM
ncbi:unnamed protein product [Mycena citricolor]|uniref:Uncharacterized protein n=1 Tax=Mycena citricolor TaxID=2018698 RepID=A0AAD2HJG2_9AGAR|nr:unnamed protein product [Mycena citricolor]